MRIVLALFACSIAWLAPPALAIDPDADTVLLRKDCTGYANCFEDDRAAGLPRRCRRRAGAGGGDGLLRPGPRGRLRGDRLHRPGL